MMHDVGGEVGGERGELNGKHGCGNTLADDTAAQPARPLRYPDDSLRSNDGSSRARAGPVLGPDGRASQALLQTPREIPARPAGHGESCTVCRTDASGASLFLEPRSVTLDSFARTSLRNPRRNGSPASFSA